ncbi:MAG TPA: VOC family protein [Tenuifilaceae bacterium]|jgi:catechol 2,3-dioxygenase-like lactoylglutathione lyase family enzyme|nr:VOC family protein [Tenuifilaceae bacterium]
MEIAYRHVGLQVVDSDVRSFYEEVLGFETTGTMRLPPEESEAIFGISQGADILFGVCHGLAVELFVVNSPLRPTFGHICIEATQPHAIAAAAMDGGYRVHTRSRNGVETFFISDSNHNTFEVKAKV